ncbi:hypothetical protein [Thauera humireducens]|uniref:hypothetical protein n=1 Tax=Thauera humireducens TaxID=1134435 RepID=UPI0009EDAE19|nr:hypothetical protein [Thauera humireducens]
MNLISQLKTASKKTAKPAAPATEPPAPTVPDVPAVPASPADDIRDLDALAAMLQQLQARNQQYQTAINALIAARRVVNGWDPKPEPELIWSVRREVLEAMGDREALAQFDQEHAEKIAAEQAERRAAAQLVLEAPARAKALEGYIVDLAAEMARDVDEVFIHEEMKRVFQPSAERMLTAARAFVQAWQEMRTVESTLKGSLRLAHYSIQGDRNTGYDMTLIGKPNQGDLLPNLIEGLAFSDLADLNRQYHGLDDALARQISQRLKEYGISPGVLYVYHPGAASDERPIYAPDPNPPSKRPQEIPFAAATVVTIHN